MAVVYMAVDSKTKAPVISLDACWEGRAHELRSRAEDLECSVCHGPVLSRAGEQNRWHFAHKNANDCPLSHTDPDRMVGRAMLYRWLATKGLGTNLAIEETVSVDGKLHQIDCVVSSSTDVRFAYLFFAAGVRDRERLLEALRASYSYCYFTFHAKTIRSIDTYPNGIITSTMHRTALRLYGAGGGYYHDSRMPILAPESLHVIDPSTSSLTTYRNVRCKVEPRVFTGKPVTSLLLDMRISSKTGELTHPCEADVFKARSRRRAEEEEARQKAREKQRPPRRTR